MRQKREIRIGTCGFRSTKEEYVKSLSTVEIQHTFYQPPQVATLERWRKEVPVDFEFTLKAWQLITHEASSPTYKRLRRKLTEEESTATGAFKPTKIVKEAWEITLAAAQALKARTILFQCPARFEPTRTNVRNMEKFFSAIDRNKMNFAWEPRGDWSQKTIKRLCTDLNLWHVVDPFNNVSATPDRLYYRLHGRVRWRYEYEDSELQELAEMMPKGKLAYVFFNNITMIQDAAKFQELQGDRGRRV